MVDFRSLVGTRTEAATYDLERLYASLDVKATHTELRPAQRECLAELTRRSAEKDLVLKISTGAGKTTVGLLYLAGHMRETRSAVVYLCSTLQLVEQVLDEASRIGLPALPYPGGESHPDAACMRGDAVMVCTYEKLFNARSTFTRSDVNCLPRAIVLDDAHAGVENIRKQFTLRVHDDAFIELIALLAPQCKAYHSTKWADIARGDPFALLEVPHWIWTDNSAKARDMLHAFAEEERFRLVWPFLEAVLPLCRCVISGSYAEIAPEVLPTHVVRPFDQAAHRLFMSATLVDDSLLTRELGVGATAAEHPIIPSSDRGLGERMILAPSLVDPVLDRKFVMRLCSELSQHCNVVVLTSSEQRASEWVQAGATSFSRNTFSDGVRQLRERASDLHYAVFAQRYDGVDLPDDACRVLVIDGTPRGESLVDRADSQMALAPGGVRNRTIFRIEQGMGRAVRSHADYAVVLLVGQDLATFVGRTDVLGAMTVDSRNQLQLSVELAELVRKAMPGKPDEAVRQVINQCLSRDEGWKGFYKKRVREATENASPVDTRRIILAQEERESYKLAERNSPLDARLRFQKAINVAELEGEELGVFLQRLARLAYLIDPAEGLRTQQAARERCLAVALPPQAPRKPSVPGTKSVAERFCAWFGSFASGNAAVIEAKRIADSLDFDLEPHALEDAVQQLGKALGADSFKPEQDFDEGPDNLWFWGESLLVIEVKNQNEKTLHKSDSGQLHDSLKWARESYPEFADRLLPVTVAKVTTNDKNAHYPDGARVLTREGCGRLGAGLHNLCQKLAFQGPIFLTPVNVLIEMANFELRPEQFAGRHTTAVG